MVYQLPRRGVHKLVKRMEYCFCSKLGLWRWHPTAREMRVQIYIYFVLKFALIILSFIKVRCSHALFRVCHMLRWLYSWLIKDSPSCLSIGFLGVRPATCSKIGKSDSF